MAEHFIKCSKGILKIKNKILIINRKKVSDDKIKYNFRVRMCFYGRIVVLKNKIVFKYRLKFLITLSLVFLYK